MSDGWEESAQAWINGIGEHGDTSRRYILDAPMIARITGRGFTHAIDIGCGEGRFCRIMQAHGIRTVGIDPTRLFIDRARQLNPDGDYRTGRAEALPAEDASTDLAVSYLSFIDIPSLPEAITEIHRVLKPGGTFLFANMQSFYTAGPPTGWTREADGSRRFYIDHYMDERVEWVSWAGIRIQNWHRPLGMYMGLLLKAGFILRHFAEPEPVGTTPEKAARYRRVPQFLVMEWQKPLA